ncbi:glycerol-3-phosphate dehydrogenase/oxidase [Microbacterium sp.]|uniref:glycerol-3-phosphate dehydrogenase/oxidase n=1 Tax=Microbacterium sp. TaxID=51671 RepID=UPI00333ECA2A
MTGAALPRLPDAQTRRSTLERLAETRTDVIVVGGGITGVGVTLDAASRGLRVTLLEAEDLAFGTSRWSSKLVHGGLRYLATGDFATARESAVERHLLMTRIAPHLIRPLPQLIPFGPAVDIRQRIGGTVGMAMGDLLRINARTSRSVLAAPRLVSAGTARRLAPALDGAHLRGGVLGADGQLIDDARLVVAVARTAASLGADVLTRVRVRQLHGDGVSAEDTLTGERFELSARVVVNATGVWAGGLDDGIRIRPSRGTHIIVDADLLGDPTAAMMVPHPGSISRFVFALPQQLGRVLIGLTDEDAPGPIPDVPVPDESEVAFLLQTLNRALETAIPRSAVRGAFAGLRPLVDSGETASADVSRRHLVSVSEDGFVTVLGGKLTTYRRMAQDAIDLACGTRGLDAGVSRTADLALLGAGPPGASSRSSLSRRYGTEADGVLGTARLDRPAEQVAPGIDVTRAEIEFAVRAEGALNADDVLDRRTRIGLVDADRERSSGPVEELVAATLASL